MIPIIFLILISLGAWIEAVLRLPEHMKKLAVVFAGSFVVTAVIAAFPSDETSIPLSFLASLLTALSLGLLVVVPFSVGEFGNRKIFRL